ncbi:MAG: glutathione S-transferase family protein [Geminicoccaceae bacterium]|nr:glutathione S-transferase family protein [Geminicoccaceae bacterium]MDW8371723.1 glutathione S-transferase family protein [Geminicoccaceae bacterium]
MAVATSERIAEEAGRRSEPAPVVLVQFPRVWGRNPSPFALKLETWLRLADIPFTIEESLRPDRMPKGKLPCIRDGGRLIADSSTIIAHLKATRGIDPDAGLSARQRAEALILQRLFEEHLYFVVVWARWIDPEGWETIARDFFTRVPAPLRPAARTILRRRFARMLRVQGLGRHDRDEILARAREDLAALSARLGDRPFFMGEQLTTIDAVAFGFLANILLVPVEGELKRLAQGFANLVAFCETMEAGIYGEGRAEP